MPRPLGRLATALTALAPHAPRDSGDLGGDTPWILGHRGASAVAPENTHPAFTRAADAGFGLELDVGLSGDGTPIVLHDDRIDRTTNGRGFADKLPDPLLTRLDAGSWFHATFADATIPTLAEVLARYAHRVTLDLEIKRPRPGGPWRSADLARAVVADIVAAGVGDRVFVTSFSPFVLAEVRRRAPAVRRGLLIGTFQRSALGPTARFVLRHAWLNRLARPDILAIEHTLLTRHYVHAARRHGYRLAAWTVNDPDRARVLVRWGVEILITDRPSDLARSLRA